MNTVLLRNRKQFYFIHYFWRVMFSAVRTESLTVRDEVM